MRITIDVHGETRRGEVDSSTRLIDFLRNDFGLTSVREGCGVSECGARTVLLADDPGFALAWCQRRRPGVRK